jgi:hypothetical protein
MESDIIPEEPDKMDQIIDYLKSIQVSFEVLSKKDKNTKLYNPEYVKKILTTKHEKSTNSDPSELRANI